MVNTNYLTKKAAAVSAAGTVRQDMADKDASIGFDPLDFVRSAADVDSLAEQIVNRGRRQDEVTYTEKYWPDVSKSVLKALIYLELENTNIKEEK